MKLISDRYNGVTLDYSDGFNDFEGELLAILDTLSTQNLLWITVLIENSELIPLLTKHGFIFYDCDADRIILLKKLVDNPVMPTATNHTMGVGAAIIDGDQLLVIRDRFHNSYKLPGGHIDSNEHISEAMVREVFEETGIDVVFESIVSLGHFFPGQFDESNLYIVCRGKALTKEINIHDCEEIVDAKWIDIQTYLNDKNNYIYNRMIVEAALGGGILTIDQREMPKRFNFSRELFF